MDYYKIINLNKEPFSNSPDPEYFFQSRQHLGCLQKIELSLRLRRGLNVVIGDVGTGKTTLCRQLIRKFAANDKFETHLILDPAFGAHTEFLTAIVEMLTGNKPEKEVDDRQKKEIIKQYLFQRGVDEQKTVILIIDEGQKIPLFCLEILREFLNFETNEYKLLQIIIFAQKEFENVLKEHANLGDRVNLYHLLEPLNFKDTRQMIRFRIKQAGRSENNAAIFSFSAFWAIYRATGGYPRKIVTLCHQCIMTMIIQNRSRAGWFLVRSCANRSFLKPIKRRRKATAFILLVLAAVVAGFTLNGLKIPAPWKAEEPIKINLQKNTLQPDPHKIEKQDDDLITEHIMTDRPSLKLIDNSSIKTEDAGITVVDIKDDIKTDIKTDIKNIDNDKPVIAGSDKEPGDRYGFKILGRVAIKKKETLGQMIQNVYGIFNSYYLKEVSEANPHIDNPDSIGIGEAIFFPAIAVPVKPLAKNCRWVEIGKNNNLKDGLRLLRSYSVSSKVPPIRLIPYWNSREGLKFALVLKECFMDETSAGNRLADLPPLIAPNGKIVSLWDKETIFFADPFLF